MNERKKKKIIGIVLVFVIAFMAIGFSLLSSNLIIKGTSVIDSTFKVLITDAYANEYRTGKNEYLSYNAKTVNFKVGLAKPNDSVSYIFKVENQGSINAFLESIDDSAMIDSDYIKWNLVKLEDGENENTDFIGSKLNSGDYHIFKLTVYFEESILTPPSEPLELNMQLDFKYSQ